MWSGVAESLDYLYRCVAPPAAAEQRSDEKVQDDLRRLKVDLERWTPLHGRAADEDEGVRAAIQNLLAPFIGDGNPYFQPHVNRTEFVVRSCVGSDKTEATFISLMSKTVPHLDKEMEAMYESFIESFPDQLPLLFEHLCRIGMDIDIIGGVATGMMWNMCLDQSTVERALQLVARVLAAGSGVEVREAVLQETLALFEAMSETLFRIHDWPFCAKAMKEFKAWNKTTWFDCLAQGTPGTPGVSDELCRFVRAVDVKASDEIEVSYCDEDASTAASDARSFAGDASDDETPDVQMLYCTSEAYESLRQHSDMHRSCGFICEIFGFSWAAFFYCTASRLRQAISAACQSPATRQGIHVASAADTMTVLSILHGKGVRLAHKVVRWHDGKTYLKERVPPREYEQLCYATFLESVRQHRFISCQKLLTDKAQPGQRFAEVFKVVGTLHEPLQEKIASNAALTNLMEHRMPQIGTRQLLENASLPHQARHALCRMFVALSQSAPERVAAVLRTSVAHETQARRRKLTIFASASTVRLVSATLVVELFTSILDGCPQLEDVVRKSLRLLVVFNIAFAMAAQEIAKEIFTPAYREELKHMSFAKLADEFGDQLRQLPGCDKKSGKAAMAIIDRQELPPDRGAVAYAQAVAASLDADVDAASDAEPFVGRGSLCVTLPGFNEESVLRKWLASERWVFDGSAAPVVAILPGALAELVGFEKISRRPAEHPKQMSLEVKTQTRQDDEISTIRLWTKTSAKVQRWVEMQAEAVEEASPPAVAVRLKATAGGSIISHFLCLAHDQLPLDALLATLQNRKVQMEFTHKTGIVVESVKAVMEMESAKRVADIPDDAQTPPKLRRQL